MTNVLKEMVQHVVNGHVPMAELAKARITECEKCPSFKQMLRQCGECHCFMDLKTKFVHTGCPLDKW